MAYLGEKPLYVVIREWRKSKRFSIREAARYIGCSSTTVAKMEKPGSNPKFSSFYIPLKEMGIGFEAIGHCRAEAGTEDHYHLAHTNE